MWEVNDLVPVKLRELRGQLGPAIKGRTHLSRGHRLAVKPCGGL